MSGFVFGVRRLNNFPHVEPAATELRYEADLLGNIQQALSGLQGYDVMALELIQNADDAAATTIRFDVRDDGLIVSNDSSFSTCGLSSLRCPWETEGDPHQICRPCNFHAIARMGSRSKVDAPNQTGRFGIGFVSVYQVTDSPVIRSSGTEMRLDPLNGRAPAAPIEITGTDFILAWARDRSPTRQALKASPTPADVADLVASAAAGVTKRGLFFLRNLRRIEVLRNSSLVSAASIERRDGIVTLTATDGSVERWLVLSAEATPRAAASRIYERFEILKELKRSPKVDVAIPLTTDEIDGLLYAYLPTQQASCLPLHVNGDFFPHANRRAVVLEGESHDRYWNELLLETAAGALKESFAIIRDQLGAVRLWALLKAAEAAKNRQGFKAFWPALSSKALTTPSIWTVGSCWRLPVPSRLPPERMSTADQGALEAVGIAIVDQVLWPFAPVLKACSVAPLQLSHVLDAFGKRGEDPQFTLEDPNLRRLWSAVDTLVADARRSGSSMPNWRERLKASVFIVDLDGNPTAIDSVYRVQGRMDPALVKGYAPSCPIAHPSLAEFPEIYSEIDQLPLNHFAHFFAERVTSPEAALEVIGPSPGDARRFYSLLTAFEADAAGEDSGAALSEVPILRTHDGFVEPSRGQLPGGFVDPIGHLRSVDAALMDAPMRTFAERVLKVEVLSFVRYVRDHLDEVLASGPSKEQYRALLLEIVRHEADRDAIEHIAECETVRTRAGSFSRPDECYFWSAEMEALLGADEALWVDEDWFPSGAARSAVRTLFTEHLGLPPRPSIRHLVDRLEGFDDPEQIDEIVPIVRHILDRFKYLNAGEKRELERLRSTAFLPGQISGEVVAGRLFTPAEVYRAPRAQGFDSQVPSVGLGPLRSTAVVDFLEFLRMPAEPPTKVVVAHLRHCVARGVAAHDLTYAILHERLKEQDASEIDDLAGEPFIWDPALARYIGADAVFWKTPPLSRWQKATERMANRGDLFRRLGVEDAPGPAHFASLLVELAEDGLATDEDRTTHTFCLGWLADALDRGEPLAAEAIDGLRDERAMISIDGTPVYPEDAAWVDSEGLALLVGGELDDRLIRPPAAPRYVVARFFERLGIPPLTQIMRPRLASAPGGAPAPEATELLRERAPLLLWLAPTAPIRAALVEALADCEVRLSDSVLVRAETVEFDPPFVSRPKEESAFFDAEASTLHVSRESGREINWATAFKAILSHLDRHTIGIETPPIVLTAKHVIATSSYEEARRDLFEAGFRPPEEVQALAAGSELADVEETESAGDADAVEIAASPSSYDQAEAHDGHADEVDAPGTAAPTTARVREKAATGAGRAHGTVGQQKAPAKTPEPEVDEETEIDVDQPYGSKPGNAFATPPRADGAGPDRPQRQADPPPAGAPRAGDAEPPGHPPAARAAGLPGASGGGPNRPRRENRSRLRSYVSPGSGTGGDGAQSADDELIDMIDAAAMEAALRYEIQRGWRPERQHHYNKGFDILSNDPATTSRRIIEVKGLEGEWTERGVKLSPAQYAMAEQHPAEFWIYVVTHARDLSRQRVYAISNPFAKVGEYWFDLEWKPLAEEQARAADLNVRVGARVKHAQWGTGQILEVKRQGNFPFLVVDFGTLNGRKAIPYHPATLTLVD